MTARQSIPDLPPAAPRVAMQSAAKRAGFVATVDVAVTWSFMHACRMHSPSASTRWCRFADYNARPPMPISEACGAAMSIDRAR